MARQQLKSVGVATALALVLAAGCDPDAAHPTMVAATSSALIPPTLGWYEVPDTKLRSVCPPNNFGGETYDFSFYCQAVLTAWGGGAMDTTRNRLIMWGGGHGDYYGNEIYAFDVTNLRMQRLNDPSLPLTRSGPCSILTMPDGKPNSRHTYDNLTYMPNVDKMLFAVGGAPACPLGFPFGRDTWTLDLSNLTWTRIYERAPILGDPGIAATAYDPNTNKVMVHGLSDFTYLYAYDPVSDSYQQLSQSEAAIDYHSTGVVDPVKRKFVVVGAGGAANGGVAVYDIGPGSTHQIQRLVTTGGDAIVNSDYPGLAFDPVSERIIAWNGGDTVYSLDLDTNVWTPTTFSGGPGPAQVTGTYKRWSYSPASGVFVLVNGPDQNAFTFRLNAGGPAAPRNLRIAP